MSRSLKKGIYINSKLEKKIKRLRETGRDEPIKTWCRSSSITPEMIGLTFLVHNGKDFLSVKVIDEMVGHRLGEFSPSKKFQRHGGKMEKEMAKKEKK